MGLLKLKPSEVRYITKIEIPKFPLKVLKSKAAQAKYFSTKAGRQRVTKFPKLMNHYTVLCAWCKKSCVG